MSVSPPELSAADVDLAYRVRLFLNQQRLINRARVVIEARRGIVTIRGAVSTFHQRQLIVSAARRVAGATQIADELDVDPPQVARAAVRSTNQPLTIVASTVAIVVLLVLAGCGRSGPPRAATNPTTGSITYQGQSIGGAFLALHPKAGSAADVPTATALVQPDGKFAVTTYDTGDGVPEGDYVVTVQWRKATKSGGDFVPGPNLLPAKYSRPESSDVIVHVATGTNELPPIVLKR
jgi:BON domain/Prokaryotic lipoprotein-attachment site